MDRVDEMLTQREIIKKVRDLHERFDWCLKNKQGRAAWQAYMQALTIANFCKFPKEVMIELFGDKTDEENPVNGLFRSEDIDRAGAMMIKQDGEMIRNRSAPSENVQIRYVYL